MLTIDNRITLYECLGADQAAICQVYLGLVVAFEALSIDGVVQPALQPQPLFGGLVTY
jgi:hypothetical protein